MLLVLCVDLDDDLGRKTGFETPVIGRDAVEEAAVALATADPEDSDVNVIFEGVHIHDTITATEDESVEVAVVTGLAKGDVAANRKVGEEVDRVLASLQTGEDVRGIVVTDGAQDESVIPVIRSRVPIDSVRRVVVRQAQNLESMYYTIKQVLDDPETRGTILVPLGILLLIYPVAILADQLGLPGSTLGVLSGFLGLYVLFRGLGLEETVDGAIERARVALYTGRMTLVTSVVALALIAVGMVSGQEYLTALSTSRGDLPILATVAAVTFGAVEWFAAAGIVASLGRVTDEYLADSLRWRYLNAPFYVLAIAVVVHALSAYLLELNFATLAYLAAALTAGTLLSLASTLAFAVAESRLPRKPDTVA
jgi:putative membrane protein